MEQDFCNTKELHYGHWEQLWFFLEAARIERLHYFIYIFGAWMLKNKEKNVVFLLSTTLIIASSSIQCKNEQKKGHNIDRIEEKKKNNDMMVIRWYWRDYVLKKFLKKKSCRRRKIGENFEKAWRWRAIFRISFYDDIWKKNQILHYTLLHDNLKN